MNDLTEIASRDAIYKLINTIKEVKGSLDPYRGRHWADIAAEIIHEISTRAKPMNMIPDETAPKDEPPKEKRGH